MFSDWIQESRERFAGFGWRWTILGRRRQPAIVLRRSEIDESRVPGYLTLIDQGTVHWAAIAQANDCLFDEGSGIGAPGNVIFGDDSYFDAHPHHLVKIARRIYELKNTFPEEPALGKVAAIITDEQNGVTNWRLPFALTDGHIVFVTTVLFYRMWLPNGLLQGPLLPVVAAPEVTGACMPLPLSCWPVALRRSMSPLEDAIRHGGKLFKRPVSKQQLDEDEREARQHPHQPARADELVPGASAAIVSLTPACAKYLRELAKKSNAPREWHVQIGADRDDYSLDLVCGPISADHAVVRSEDISIAYPKNLERRFRGTVIDYRLTPNGGWFRFIESR